MQRCTPTNPLHLFRSSGWESQVGERPRRGHGTREAIRRGDSEEQRKYALMLDRPPRLGLICGFTVTRLVSPTRYPKTPSPAYHGRGPPPPMPQPHPHLPQPTSVEPTESPTSIDESQPLPNPNASVEDEGPSPLDERSLNALAAREISKQMEMSSPSLSPPFLPFAGRRSVPPRPLFTSEIPPYPARAGLVRSPSTPPPPPPPPPPQFAKVDATTASAAVDEYESSGSAFPPTPVIPWYPPTRQAV